MGDNLSKIGNNKYLYCQKIISYVSRTDLILN